MTRGTKQHHSINELNSLRRQAVELRLGGATLAETQSSVGLTAPTVIAAMKAYKSGGWQAVDVGLRGRPRTTSSGQTSDQVKEDLLDAILSSAYQADRNAVWDIDKVQDWMTHQEIDVSKSTVLNWLRKWDLLPPSRYTTLRSSAEQSPGATNWREEHQIFARRARRKGTSVFWVSSRTIEHNSVQLFAHDLRGHAFWTAIAEKPSSEHYLHFFQSLKLRIDTDVALVLSNAYINSGETLHRGV